MAITVDMIKELREKTGSGMMDCKKALTENDGDMQKAIIWLREKGISSADKKMSRIAAEGVVDAYIHAGGRVGVLLEVNIETDFAAKNEEFRKMVRDIGMQIAAMSPRWVSKADVPAEEIEKNARLFATRHSTKANPRKLSTGLSTAAFPSSTRRTACSSKPTSRMIPRRSPPWSRK